MKRLAIALLCLALCGGALALEKVKKEKDPNNPDAPSSKGGNLASALFLLTDYGAETRQERLDLYSACYNVLAKDTVNASFADVAADADVQRLAKKQGVVLLGGPMLGCVTQESATVWLRTIRPAEVFVFVTINGKERVFGPVASTDESDLVAIVPVTGLEAGKSYPYRVVIDGKSVVIPENAAIPTAPLDAKSSTVRIAFGTCFHRWGLGHRAQSAMILSRKPNAILLHGDIAVQDRNNLIAMHRADYMLRDFHVAWQNIAAATPVYAVWDDHDYFDNDKAGIPKGYELKDKQAVRDIFVRNWNNPSAGFNDERRGIFFRTRVGPCDVIMLDDRYFRTGEPGTFLGDGQLAWLKEQLLDCKGPFIILACGTMWSDYVSNGKDSWGKWDPEGREKLFTFIEDNNIPGVLLISGDRHGARGFTIPRPSGFEFYEFEAASLGGRSGPGGGENPLYFIKDQYAFGEFTIDNKPKDPEVTFRLIFDTGEVHYEKTLKRSTLTPR